jgi:hypothetical protein
MWQKNVGVEWGNKIDYTIDIFLTIWIDFVKINLLHCVDVQSPLRLRTKRILP